jgi:hypothetical protein
MNRGIIYLILNKQNGHKYVGKTTLAMNKEWVHHIDRSKRMSSEPLHKAFRQFGVHNFMIKELDEYDDNSLENKLNQWIEQYQPEYNEYTPPPEVVTVIETPPVQVSKKNSQQYKSWGSLTDANRSDGKHFGLKIRGKNLETGLCTDYESARVAAEQVTGNPRNNSNILKAARTGRTAYGYKWQILEEKKKKKSVFGVNKKSGEIGPRYESIAETIRVLGDSGKGAGLIKSLKNPGRYSWKGHWWFFDR